MPWRGSDLAACLQRLLGLTTEQRQSLVQLRAVCLGTLGTIMDERNRIHAFLTVGPPSAPCRAPPQRACCQQAPPACKTVRCVATPQ